MVREPYDCIVGDAPVGAIPLGRMATVRGSLRRHAYAAMVEAMMSRRQSSAKPEGRSELNLNAAGIDVGATSHDVAVPADRAEQPVREFAAFTTDLYRLAGWLAGCGMETVVMESTGAYWIPLFGVLEARRIQVMLVEYGSHHIQHMQKALTQMNVKLPHVISDIAGQTGMEIIEAMVGGQRDPVQLAQRRDYRIRADEETITRSLQGHWWKEHIFELTQALELYRAYRARLRSAIGKSKPIWSGLRTAVPANLQRRSRVRSVAKETRPASMFGRTCIG